MDLLRASLSGVFLGLLFHRLGLPGGAVVGAMLGTGLAQLLASPAPTPRGLDLTVQLAAGVLVGLSFRKELLSPKLLPYAPSPPSLSSPLPSSSPSSSPSPWASPQKPSSSPSPPGGSRAWGP